MPKGKKGKGKKEPDPNALTEVAKTFYELRLEDLNKKLDRMQNIATRLETNNRKLQEQYSQVDDETNGAIGYVKRTLAEKTSEMVELCDAIDEIEKCRSKEALEFEQTVCHMQEEYKLKQLQLKSEIKLLTGKLSSIEEFRALKDVMTNNVEIKEAEMNAKEKKHSLAVMELEKKFAADKDKLRKGMEDKLNDLSNEFQESTAVRITSTTHRVIRENISASNEMENALETQKRLQKENEDFKNDNKSLHHRQSALKIEIDKILDECSVKETLVTLLKDKLSKLVTETGMYHEIEDDLLEVRRAVASFIKDNQSLHHRKRMLEQNLHASKCHASTLKCEFEDLKNELEQVSFVMQQSLMYVKDELARKPSSKDGKESINRQSELFKNLLVLISGITTTTRKPSLESVHSASSEIDIGDLGFIPRVVQLRSFSPIKRHVETETYSKMEKFGDVELSVIEAEEKLAAADQVDETNLLTKTSTQPTKITCVFNESSEELSTASSEEALYHVTLPSPDEMTKSKAADETQEIGSTEEAEKDSSEEDYNEVVDETQQDIETVDEQEVDS